MIDISQLVQDTIDGVEDPDKAIQILKDHRDLINRGIYEVESIRKHIRLNS